MFKHKNMVRNGLIFRDDKITFAQLEENLDSQDTEGQQYFASVRQLDAVTLPQGYIVDGEIRDQEGLQIILSQCVKEWNLKGKQVSISVPDALLFVRKISIPAEVEDKDLLSYVNFELGEGIRIPIENPIIDVKRKHNKEEAVLFATDRNEMMKYTNLLHACRLVGERADASSLALYRFYEKNRMIDNDMSYLLLNLTTTSAVASIFTRGEVELSRYFQPLQLTDLSKLDEDKKKEVMAQLNAVQGERITEAQEEVAVHNEKPIAVGVYERNYEAQNQEDIVTQALHQIEEKVDKIDKSSTVSSWDQYTEEQSVPSVEGEIFSHEMEETADKNTNVENSLTMSKDSLNDILNKIDSGWAEVQETPQATSEGNPSGGMDDWQSYINQEEIVKESELASEGNKLAEETVEPIEKISPVGASPLVDTEPVDIKPLDIVTLQDVLQDLYFELERLIKFYRNSLNNEDEDLRYVVFSGDHPYLHEVIEQIAGALELEVVNDDSTNIAITSDGKIDKQWFEVMGLCISEV